MASNYMMYLRVSGDETTLREFLTACQYMQRLGEVGATRDVIIKYDGDGAARLQFWVNDEKLPSADNEIVKESIATGKDIKVFVGY